MKILIFGLTLFLATPMMALADPWREGTAIITCYPGAGYFRLQSEQSYPEGMGPELGQKIGPTVYSAEKLEREPLTCTLPGSEILVEGRDTTTGNGPCGARIGKKVRILINGKPVSYKFDNVDRYSTATDLENGWIELSSCFERMHTVTVFSRPEIVAVELCRMTDGKQDPSTGILSVNGTCKNWYGNDGAFSLEK